MCCTATIFSTLLPLAGCADISADPFEWWNQLEGGAIAAQRPPPPGATDPYQPVELIPAKPAPTDPATRQRIANQLANDQAIAQEIGAEDPITAKSTPNGGPSSPPPLSMHPAALPKPPDMAPADPNAANATIQAAETTPVAASPPPAEKPPSRTPTPTASVATPASSLQPIADAPLPPIPAVPPPLPRGLPEGFTIPSPPPDVAKLVTPAVTGVALPVTFRTGQAAITAAATAALRSLVNTRGTKDIRVIGRGEAASYDPAVQAKALQLAVQRAQAIADVLRRAGLPASAMRITADPFGRGGAAMLIS